MTNSDQTWGCSVCDATWPIYQLICACGNPRPRKYNAKMGGLRDTLSSMVEQAQLEPGLPVRVRLARELTISVVIKEKFPKIVHLQLSRPDVFPSLDEWRTTVSMLPPSNLVGVPSQKHLDVYYLMGRVVLK